MGKSLGSTQGTFEHLEQGVKSELQSISLVRPALVTTMKHSHFPALPAAEMLKAKLLIFNMDKLPLKEVQVGREAEDSVLRSNELL